MSLKEVSETTFQEDVTDQSGLVLVDFWAPWCPPCRAITPVLEEIAEEEGDKVRICKVNIDDNPDIATKLNVKTIPTLMLFKGGVSVATQLGAVPKKSLVEWIHENTD